MSLVLCLAEKGLQLKDPASLKLRGQLPICRWCLYCRLKCRTIIGEVRLGDGVTIGANCVLEDVEIMADSVIKDFTMISGATRGNSSAGFGLYARIRPNTSIGNHGQIGNFVEIKNSTIASHCKINHHGFIGDATIGRNVIVGAGTITCNFNGVRNNITVVEDNAFIGSGVMLVAPITVGTNSFIGAGSTIVDNVLADSLTIGRAKQVSIKGWVKKGRKT